MYHQANQKNRTARWLALIGIVGVSISLVIMAASFIIPSLITDPGYSNVPNACQSVSPQTMRRAFATNQESLDDQVQDSSKGERSSTCQWRTDGSIGQVRNGRFGRLSVDIAAKFDENGNPDVDSINDSLTTLEKSPKATPISGLDSRAVAIAEDGEVRLVAGRANLTVEIKYRAVELNNAHETPVSNDELEAVTHQVAQEVLAKAGQPQ